MVISFVRVSGTRRRLQLQHGHVYDNANNTATPNEILQPARSMAAPSVRSPAPNLTRFTPAAFPK